MNTSFPIKSTGTLEFDSSEQLASNASLHAIIWHKLIDAGFPLEPTLLDWTERPTEDRMKELIKCALSKCGAKVITKSENPDGTMTFRWR